MKVRFQTKKIVVCLFTLYLFWGLKPYFTWSTFKDGIFGDLLGVNYSSIFLLLSLIAIFITQNKLKLNNFSQKYSIFTFLCGLLLIGICGLNFKNLFSFEWLAYISIIIWICMPHDERVSIYNLYLTLFAVTLIPSIIYFTLRIINVSIPYDIVESVEVLKNDHGFSYTHYPFAIQLRHQLVALANIRLCGIYDEAGKLGTVAALFLTSEQYKLKKKWRNIIIFIAGILSMSVGFYVLTLAYFILSNISKRKFKNAVYIIAMVLTYIVFINIPIKNQYISSIQSRIIITSSGLSGDNRTNDAYNTVYKEVYEDPLALLIGYGSVAMGEKQDELLIDGASYKSLIYSFGFLGFGISLVWLLVYSIHYKKVTKNRYIWVIFIIYLLNIYQRPSAFFPPYLMIALGGIEKLESDMKNSLNIKSIKDRNQLRQKEFETT